MRNGVNLQIFTIRRYAETFSLQSQFMIMRLKSR
jgi:hypothetical protein